MNHLKSNDILTDHHGRVWCVRWSHNGKYIASAGEDQFLKIWSFDSLNSKWFCKFSNKNHVGSIRSLSWSPSDKYIASCGFDGQIIIWEIYNDSLDIKETLDHHKSEVKHVSWSYNGDYLASCGRDTAVNIYDVHEDFEIIETPSDVHTEDVKCVSWHPSKEILASCGFDNSIGIISQNLDEWLLNASFNAHEHIVRMVNFNYTGTILGSCSDDRTVKLWITLSDISSWCCINTIAGYHTETIWDISWNPNRNLLVSCSRDNSICIYDVEEIDDETGDCKSRIINMGHLAVRLIDQIKEAHEEDINSICWNNDGKILVTGSDDWTLKLWNFVDLDMPID